MAKTTDENSNSEAERERADLGRNISQGKGVLNSCARSERDTLRFRFHLRNSIIMTITMKKDTAATDPRMIARRSLLLGTLAGGFLATGGTIWGNLLSRKGRWVKNVKTVLTWSCK